MHLYACLTSSPPPPLIRTDPLSGRSAERANAFPLNSNVDEINNLLCPLARSFARHFPGMGFSSWAVDNNATFFRSVRGRPVRFGQRMSLDAARRGHAAKLPVRPSVRSRSFTFDSSVIHSTALGQECRRRHCWDRIAVCE